MVIVKGKVSGKNLIIFSHRDYHVIKFWVKFDKKLIECLRRNYSIAVHVGWYHKVFTIPYWVDHVYSSPSNIKSIKGNREKLCSVNSRDVLPKEFVADFDSVCERNEKDIDVVYVCNNQFNKRARELFDIVKARPDLRFALMLSYPEFSDNRLFDAELVSEIKDYCGQNQNLSFYDGIIKNGFYRFSRQEVSDLLKRSKIYVHMCRREGESRSMGEAAASGCILLAHDSFLGGGNDILNSMGAFRFSDNNDLEEKIDLALSSNDDPKRISGKYFLIRERCLSDFKKLLLEYGFLEDEISCFFEHDLSMVLPSHKFCQIPGYVTVDSYGDMRNLATFRETLLDEGIKYRTSVFVVAEIFQFVRKQLLNLKKMFFAGRVF